MRLQEQKLWDGMKRTKPADFWAERIENGLMPGMPDAKVKCKEGVENWIELKAPPRPARSTTPMLGKHLRIEQINWHLKAASMNTRSWLLIRDSAYVMSLVPGGLIEFAVSWTTAEFDLYKIGWPSMWSKFREPF